jgi:HNH endonuclease
MSAQQPGRRPSRVSDEELLAAVDGAAHMAQLLTRLGIKPYGGNYESIRWRLQRLGALDERFTSRGWMGRLVTASHTYTDAELEEAAAGARSKADILRALGLPPDASQYGALNRRLDQAGLDVSELVGRGWRRGATFPPRVTAADLARRPRVRSETMKRVLLHEGILQRRCGHCGLAEWNGAPIPLELDHVNGDRSDNRLENLRLLCPNCHAQTPTYRGRNIGAGMAAFVESPVERLLARVLAQ